MEHKNTSGNTGSTRQGEGWQKVFDGRNRQVRGLWQRGPSYYAQLKVFDPDKGCRVAKRIRLEDASTVPQAAKALADLKSSRDKNRVASKVAPRIADYLKARMDADKKSLRPQTIMSRASMAKHLVEKLGDLRLTDLQPLHIRQYRESRLLKAAPQTINLEVGLLGLTLNKAVEDGILLDNPVARMKRLKGTPKRKRLYTLVEIKAAAAACLKCLPVAGQSYHDAIIFMSYSGCRIGETLQLRWETAVDWSQRRLLVGVDFTTKGKEQRAVDFNAPLASHLKAMKERRAPDSEYLFPSPRRSEKPGGDARITGWTTALATVRPQLPKGFTPHCCRHYFASMCVMSGIDYMTTARWLGHKDGGVLIGKVYGHLTPEHAAQQATRIRFEPVILEKTGT